jgi:hypothetical protein
MAFVWAVYILWALYGQFYGRFCIYGRFEKFMGALKKRP